MRGRTIELKGTTIAFEEAGEGFPLVAIHGFYPDRRLMTGSFEPLFDAEGRALVPPSAGGGSPRGGRTRRTYRRIYPDLPFMGESGDPDHIRNSDDMLRIVAAFIRQRVPEGPFLLAGESYGGYLARGLCREFGARVEGLLLLCPAIVARNAERDVPEHRPMRIEPGYAGSASPEEQAEFDSVAVIRDAYTWQRAATEVMPAVRMARSEILESFKARGYTFSFDELRNIAEGGTSFDVPFARPTLFVLGRQDASTGWKDALRLADRYPRATYAILDMAGHNAQIEQEGLLHTLTGEWLARCEDFGDTEQRA
jgi:pimeloyl-ACP methyl ester carboxylesterase